MSNAQNHKSLDVFSFDFIGASDDRGFCNCRMTNQRALNIGGADAMSGDIQHIVCASDDGEVPILIADGHIAGGVGVRNLAPVESVAGGIAIDCAEHVREGTSQHKQPAFIWRQLIPLRVDNLSDYARQRLSGFSGTRRDYRQCAEAGAARFRLPPVVSNKSPFAVAAQHAIGPHHGLRIERLASACEETDAAQIVAARQFVAMTHEHADGSWGGEDYGGAISLHQLPGNCGMRIVDGAFTEESSRSGQKRSIDDIRMSHDPANI